MDPSYVYDVTDFSDGVVRLFLEDKIPKMTLFVLPAFVKYALNNSLSLKEAKDLASREARGSEFELEELWKNPAALRMDGLEVLKKFMDRIGKVDYRQIHDNIQSSFSLRDYILYGISGTTIPVVDIFNRLIPSASIPVLYYRDGDGNTVSKTNVRYRIRPDFSVEDHIAKLGNETVLGVMDVSGRYVTFIIAQRDRSLVMETETLLGNEGYYCLSELQKMTSMIQNVLTGPFRWNIRDIRYKITSIGNELIPSLPKDKTGRKNVMEIRKKIIKDTTILIYASMLHASSTGPLRFFFRPETTTTVGSMKFRVIETDPVKWDNYQGTAVLNYDDPEDDIYEGGRMDSLLNKIGNVAISSVDAEKTTGVDIRIDVETNIQDLINTLSIVWYSFLTFEKEKYFGLQRVEIDIAKPTVDSMLRKEAYVLLKNEATGIIHRAAPFMSIWKNMICNQEVMPFIYSGSLTEDKKTELDELEKDKKYKGYKFDRSTVINFPSEDMLTHLKEKGYILYSEPIHILLPKGDKGMFLRIRDAPRRLRDAFAGLGNNYSHLFNKTICISTTEKDSEDSSATAGYTLDSIKDEIPWGKDAAVDPGFLPSLVVDGPLLRSGVPESGYSSFLAVALMVLTERLKRRPTQVEIYNELQLFVKDLKTSERTKYFLPLWKYFPGAGFTEFRDVIVESFVKDMERVVVQGNTVTDKTLLFMDSSIYSKAYGIYYNVNVVTFEYIEKNQNSYEPLELDRLCFAYPEMLNHIAEDGLATEIFNGMDPKLNSLVLLRRRYTNIYSQYDALTGGKMDTEKLMEELSKLLFEINFVNPIGGDIVVESGHHAYNVKLQFPDLGIVGQFLDNTGRQTGLKVRIGKYELGLLHGRTQPLMSGVTILPLTQAANPYNVKKLIRIIYDAIPTMKITHYSVLPLMLDGVWKNLLCGFYMTANGIEFFVPCSPYDGVPTIFDNVSVKSSVYPYHFTGIQGQTTEMVVSKLYNRQISDGLVALLLSAIRSTMIEKLIRAEWTKSTPLKDVVEALIDETGKSEVVTLSTAQSDELYQSLLNGLRSNHRLPSTMGIMKALHDKKTEYYSLLFSREGKILISTLAGTTGMNSVQEISDRIRDQIRLFWKYIPELMDTVNKDRFRASLEKFGSNHPIYRIHMLEDDHYFSYRYEGCQIIGGEEMIRQTYLIERKAHRVHHRLWSSMDTEHGPEFLVEKGLGVHRIYRVEPDTSGDIVQLSENDFPTRIDKNSVYQTRDNTFFELVGV
jgi:hypothetical protein